MNIMKFFIACVCMFTNSRYNRKTCNNNIFYEIKIKKNIDNIIGTPSNKSI